MKWDLYDEFIDFLGVDERPAQRRAVELLCTLSDATEVDSYSIQAPTGTGKSYAALLAGVHNARKGRRTVVGTSTVVLSDQYLGEISRVQRVFPEVSFGVLKGANNYFCGNKAGVEIASAKTSKRKAEMKQQLLLAAKGTLGGFPIWARAEPKYCNDCALKYKKSGKTNCEYARARVDALKCDVVVTTHAMIAVDMRMEESILGDVHLTIFDEAHRASASLIYDEMFGAAKLKKLDFNGILSVMPWARRSAFVNHFEQLKERGYADDWKWFDPSPSMASALLEMWPTASEMAAMRRQIKAGSFESQMYELYECVTFLEKARDILTLIGAGKNAGGLALWLAGGSYKIQDMIPDLDMVQAISEKRVAWLSATIGSHSRPTYSLDKCGIKTTHFELETPFDFEKQLSWTVREAGSTLPEAELIASINKHWAGGCVVLTPSHKRKERIAESLRTLDGSLMVQEQSVGGNEGNKVMLQDHADFADLGGNPVLIGVEIFSTGIDLPGPQLTKLVVAGLFPLRDDIAYANWRRRWLASFGTDPEQGYDLPERAIALEQQIGRVIRRVDDEGVVVFYVENGDWKPGSKSRMIIEEALKKFEGAVQI